MKFDILAQVLAWVILAARGCLRVTLTIPPFGFDEYEMNDVRSGKKKEKEKKTFAAAPGAGSRRIRWQPKSSTHCVLLGAAV